jgi:hypothetical protein
VIKYGSSPDNLVCANGHRAFAADPTTWAGKPCNECGGRLKVLGGDARIDEHRSASRAQPRSLSALYRQTEELLARQPKTPAGYKARLAALEQFLSES